MYKKRVQRLNKVCIFIFLLTLSCISVADKLKYSTEISPTSSFLRRNWIKFLSKSYNFLLNFRTRNLKNVLTITAEEKECPVNYVKNQVNAYNT